MRIRRHISFACCGLALACGGDSAGGADDDSTGDTGTTAASADDGPSSDPSSPSDPDESGPVDTTAGPPDECDRTVRYPLFDGQACGRLLIGEIDNDGFTDVIAFGNDGSATSPTPTTLQTFFGDAEGFDPGQLHCCLETSPTGAGVIFDLNLDGEGDPLWAGERVAARGGDPQRTLERSIRAPENGYTGDGVLFSGPESLALPFIVDKITPQEIGVIVIADGMLMSMVGSGDTFDLQPTNTLALDPVPNVTALATIEIDGQAGIDVVGVGPDGLQIWGGSIEGAYSDATVLELPGSYTYVESIDVDLDGNRELVLFGVGEPIAVVDRAAMIEVSTTDMPSVPPPATVIEVDGDLYPDVVAVEGGNLVYYPGDGDVFGEPRVLAPVGTTTDIAYGDFDGNGTDDLVACDEQGLLVVYREE